MNAAAERVRSYNVGFPALLSVCACLWGCGPGDGAPLAEGAEDSAWEGDTFELAAVECVSSGAGLSSSELVDVPWKEDLRTVAVPLDLPGAEEPPWVVITSPADGVGSGVEGAPVVVAVPPASIVQQTGPLTSAHHGVIEVQPLLPGWLLMEDILGPGDYDSGGGDSVDAVAHALSFATGELRTLEGWTLADVVDLPVCTPVVLSTSSAGAAASVGAVAELEPAVWSKLAGLTLFEPVSLPTLAVADPGMVGMDADPEGDADHDGFGWDDLRSWAWRGCGLDGCSQDYSNLTVVASDGSRPSSLFLDGDGNGVPDVVEAGELPHGDVDGSGLLEPDEDVILSPLPALLDGEEVWYFAPPTLRAAEAAGLLDSPDWSAEVVSDVEAAEAWWTERDMVAQAGRWPDALPDGMPVQVVWSEVPHGNAQPERPDLVVAAEVFEEVQAGLGLGVSSEALDCATAGQAPDHGGLLTGSTAPAQLSEHAVSEEVPLVDVRVAGAFELLLSAGVVDRCSD